MKLLPALLCAWFVPAAASATPQSLENLSVSARQGLLEVPAVAPMRSAAAKVEPFFLNPNPNPLRPSEPLGPEVGRVKLADQLDRHHDLLTLQLGPSNWDLSVAGDPSFKKYFLELRQGSRLVIAPMDIGKLRKEGVDVTVEPGVSYHFHVTVGSIFDDPIRKSTIEITPNRGTKGPSHQKKTGELLDRIKAKSYVFTAGDNEYWMLYGTDVDAKTNTQLSTHSLLFFHESGFSSKGYPLAESSVPAGQATSVTFGDQNVVLERTLDGTLIIHGE